eukprot:1176668-Prorocentrum_minimum.AAC.3
MVARRSAPFADVTGKCVSKSHGQCYNPPLYTPVAPDLRGPPPREAGARTSNRLRSATLEH